MSSKSWISQYNLFYLFLCIIWVPIQYFYLHVDGAGRTIMVLTVVAVMLNIGASWNKKDMFGSAAFICWTLLVIYSFFNSMFKGFTYEYGSLPFITTNFLNPFIYLWIACIELDNDKNRCLYVLLIGQLVYLLIGATHLSFIQFERAEATGLGNMLPMTAAGCVCVASVLLCDKKLKWGWLTYSIIVFLALLIVISAATRKALGAILIMLIGALLGRSKKIDFKNIMLILFCGFVLYAGVGWLLDNTLIGERITDSSESYDVPLSSNHAVNDFLMTLLGDRSLQYYEGISLHRQYPLTGIGVMNYVTKTGAFYRLHTEYMVQYCENGSIGFSLLILFYVLLLWGLKKKHKDGENTLVYSFALLMVLFINLTAWTYNMQYIMIIYAILISHNYSKQNITIKK